MSAYFRQAGAADGPRILELIRRTPQRGQIVLNFERDPDFFLGAAVSCEQPEVWVADSRSKPGEVATVYSMGQRPVYLNGKVTPLRYGSDLRVDPGSRGSTMLVRVAKQFRQSLAEHEFMQTVILEGNDASLSTVASGRAGLPVYYPCGEIETSMVYTRQRRCRPLASLQLRRATAADIPLLQAFYDREAARHQFAPAYRFAGLLDGTGYFQGLKPENFVLACAAGSGELLGMAADWDQSGFKKTRVLAYPGALRWIRPAYNLAARVFGGLQLPASGDCFRYRSVHTVMIANDDGAVFDALLDRLLADNRDCDAVIVGFFAGHPLATRLAGRRRRLMKSRHFLVSFDGDPRPGLDPGLPPYIDVARL